MNKEIKKEIFTIPNLLSLFRIALIPVYAYIYLNATETKDYILAAVILGISTITDFFDGIIARRYNMITRLGKMLDPFADKATQGILMICLGFKYWEMWVLFGMFVLKEGFMLTMGLFNLKKGRMLKKALFAGKICTTVLFVSMIILILLPNLKKNVVYILLSVCAIFMIISFVEYFLQYFKRQDQIENLREQ